MTLQVALEASNGFVIASDRKASRGFRGMPAVVANTSRQHIRGVSSDIRKIIVSPSGGFICAFSGDDLSKNVADGLIAACPSVFASDEAIETFLKDTSHAIIDKGVYPENQQVIVGIVADGVSPLWRVFYFASQIIAQPIHFKITGGDDSNPAAYLLERFYKKLTVSELQFLAAHFIIEGRTFSTHIRGLDVLVVEDGKLPRFLAADQLEMLEDQSEAVHHAITKLLVPIVSSTKP